MAHADGHGKRGTRPRLTVGEERKHERDPQLRGALLVAALALVPGGQPTAAQRRLAQEAVATVPPGSALWGLEVGAALNVASLQRDAHLRSAFLEALAQHNPDARVSSAVRAARSRSGPGAGL